MRVFWPSPVAVFGCGHSSDTRGPSSGTTTATPVRFWLENPRTVAAFGDSITFGVLEERKIRANLDTANNYPNVLQGLLQCLDPAWRVIDRGQGGELVQDGATRISDLLRSDRPGFVLMMEGTNNASRCDNPAFITATFKRCWSVPSQTERSRSWARFLRRSGTTRAPTT